MLALEQAPKAAAKAKEAPKAKVAKEAPKDAAAKAGYLLLLQQGMRSRIWNTCCSFCTLEHSCAACYNGKNLCGIIFCESYVASILQPS